MEKGWVAAVIAAAAALLMLGGVDARRGHDDVKVVHFDGKDCTVRLVSSPDPTCNVMTDFGGGKCGVRPHHPSVVHRGMLKYTVGPFYFTSPSCDEPETSPQEDDDD
ncbi:hypothetical protein C4D60_Mb08t12790 [Musa balbisiana]|uniref:Phytocyanin domain-containing protein n=1 Tax=Musa balbisiana TaxID=52838 RepID=A0A4S8K3B6_MUSBA|nr:hypothetical protein C4D60_Mb08t12790 [Musa balbisiana]